MQFRKLGVLLFAVMILLLAAGSSAQASTVQQTRGVASALHVGTWCTTYHHSTQATAFGYVHVGYFEIDVGVCYDTTTWRPTLSWGPYCSSGWYVPFIRTTANNYCTWWRNSNGSITLYGAWTAQLWLPVIGWCCDRNFTYSYGV